MKPFENEVISKNVIAIYSKLNKILWLTDRLQ